MLHWEPKKGIKNLDANVSHFGASIVIPSGLFLFSLLPVSKYQIPPPHLRSAQRFAR
jgi:hypothetical protein